MTVKDNIMTDSTRQWWNMLTNMSKMEISRKLGWKLTFRMWDQLETWEQESLIAYWLKR